MASYNPPNEILPIFNYANYDYEDLTPLTQGLADARYLKRTGGTALGLINFLQGLSLNDGAVATPSASFSVDATTGFYRGGAGILSVASSGINSFNFGSTFNSSEVQFRIPDGTVAAPSLAFINQTNTGMYRPTTNQLAFSVNGVQQLRLEFTNNNCFVNRIFTNQSGTVSAPAWAYAFNPSTGFYNSAGGLGISINGVLKMDIAGTITNSYQNIDLNNNQLVNAPQIGNAAGNLELRVNNSGSGGTLTLTGGTGLLAATAGGSAGQHLVLTINGTVYKIALLNV